MTDDSRHERDECRWPDGTARRESPIEALFANVAITAQCVDDTRRHSFGEEPEDDRPLVLQRIPTTSETAELEAFEWLGGWPEAISELIAEPPAFIANQRTETDANDHRESDHVREAQDGAVGQHRVVALPPPVDEDDGQDDDSLHAVADPRRSVPHPDGSAQGGMLNAAKPALLGKIFAQAPEFVFSTDLDTLVEGIRGLDLRINKNRYLVGQGLNLLTVHLIMQEAYGFVSVGDFIEFLARELKVSVSLLYKWKKDATIVDNTGLLPQYHPGIDPIKMIPAYPDFVRARSLDCDNIEHYADLIRAGEYDELKAEVRKLSRQKRLGVKKRPRPAVTGLVPVTESALDPFQRRLYAFIEAGLTPVICALVDEQQEERWDRLFHDHIRQCVRDNVDQTKACRLRAFAKGQTSMPPDLDTLVREIEEDFTQIRKDIVFISMAMRQLWEDAAVKQQILDRGFNSVEAFCRETLPQISIGTCRAYRDMGRKMIQYRDELIRAGFGDHSCAWNLRRIETALNRYPEKPDWVFEQACHLNSRAFREVAKGRWLTPPDAQNPKVYPARVVRKAQPFELEAELVRYRGACGHLYPYPGVIGVHHPPLREGALMWAAHLRAGVL